MAALSLSGLNRAEYLAGAWDSAVVASERAIALAVESEDRWVIALAHWSASDVPSARGDWPVAEAHVRAIQEQSPTFERHIAAEAIATAGLAAAQDRPRDVLPRARAARADRTRDGVDDPAFLPWQHLKAHALVDAGELDAAEQFIASASALATARSQPRCSRHGWLTRAAGSTSRATTSRAPLPRSRTRGPGSSRSACRTSKRSSS